MRVTLILRVRPDFVPFRGDMLRVSVVDLHLGSICYRLSGLLFVYSCL